MVMGEKSQKSFSERMYRKEFNKNDPFDQLIMEMGQNGILDICVVGIGTGPKKQATHEYSRRPHPSKGKHSL